MSNKYCKNANFWSATMNKNASFTWKMLLSARKWCKGVIDKKLAMANILMCGLIHGSMAISDRYIWGVLIE